MYFYVQLILHELCISLPHEDGHWFYTTDYAIFGHEVKATERSPPDNLKRWIITQSKGFTRKSIEKISRSMMAYVYLVLSSQVEARSTIVGNSAPAVDGQQLFKDRFKSLINKACLLILKSIKD